MKPSLPLAFGIACLALLCLGAAFQQNLFTTNDPPTAVSAAQGLFTPGPTVIFSTDQQGRVVIGTPFIQNQFTTNQAAAANAAAQATLAQGTNVVFYIDPQGRLVINSTATSGGGLSLASSNSALRSTRSGLLGSNGHPVFSPDDYGAVHNGVMPPGGSVSITAGNNVLSVIGASFVPGDVGKAISVVGAGPSSNTLSTTISSYISGTSVILSANAVTTVLSGDPRGNVAYFTDDTLAVQAAINACATAGGGEVKFSSGIYGIAGALVDPGDPATHLAAQLYTPHNTSLTPYAIKLRGEASVYERFQGQWTAPNTILWSTLTATGAVFVAKDFASLVGLAWSQCRVDVENLMIRCPPGSPATAIDLFWANTCYVKEVNVNHGFTEYADIFPPAAGSVGIRTSKVNNNGGASLTMLNCIAGGFEAGLEFGEHTLVENCSAYSCLRGFFPHGEGHLITMVNCDSEGNKYQLYTIDGIMLKCLGLTVENSFSGWWSPTYLIDDAGASASGEINYSFTTGGGAGELPVTNTFNGVTPGRFFAISHFKKYAYPDLATKPNILTNNFDNLIYGTNRITILNQTYPFAAVWTTDLGNPILNYMQVGWPLTNRTWQYGMASDTHFVFQTSPDGAFATPFSTPLKLYYDGTLENTNLAKFNVVTASNLTVGSVTGPLRVSGDISVSNINMSGTLTGGKVPSYIYLYNSATQLTARAEGTNGSFHFSVLNVLTNLLTAAATNTLDFAVGTEQYMESASAVTVSGYANIPVGESGTVLLSVSNSSASPFVFTWPAGTRTYGTNTGTSCSIPSASVLKALFKCSRHGSNVWAITSNN